KNTIIPNLIGIVQVGVYFVTAISLIGPLGMAGLVLANSIMLTFHALLTGFLLYRVIGGLPGLGVGATAVKSVLAALLMGLAGFGVWAALDLRLQPAGVLLNAVVLIVPTIVGAAVYVGALALLRVPELATIVGRVR